MSGTLLWSVMRVVSVCMRVMELHMYNVDLVRVIFRSAFAHDIRPQLRLHGVGAISYNSRPHMVFPLGKIKSARYITQVNFVYCHFFGRKVMCFFRRTTHVHIQLLRRNVLFVVYKQLPLPARSPDLSPIEQVWHMMKLELTLSPERATTIAELRQRVQDSW